MDSQCLCPEGSSGPLRAERSPQTSSVQPSPQNVPRRVYLSVRHPEPLACSLTLEMVILRVARAAVDRRGGDLT